MARIEASERGLAQQNLSILLFIPPPSEHDLKGLFHNKCSIIGLYSFRSLESSRQFSPDPLVNYGFMALMAGMGMDLVYKMFGVLKYFEPIE